ncbi:DUF6089 family protein [Leeuwenhoekiella polynyae]|uniref:DUF6089 domain-containing protein n=1 Tax=Leeuwenhoekiella polynyae TaxID=1550906 RepID=A0A4Q0PEJ2_9FLAO|nr:DUF6089 family protein [Leeuwenhoekiella polynyae]RXG25233.1 hypothetical protein DSM02_1203 [Leeuwenhoekiella polynyae]
MKAKVFVILITIITVNTLKAQKKTYDLGLYLGGVNYYGELGEKKFVAPNRATLGLIGKMNFNEKLSLRGTVTFFTLYDNDRDAADGYRGNGRNNSLYYSFENTSIEASLGFEYVPFSFFKNAQNPIAVYIHAGLGAVYNDELYYPISAGFEDVLAEKYGTRTRMVVPFGLGFKTFVGSNFMLGLELSPRYTMTDNLDGSHPDHAQLAPNKLPDFSNNDWYTFVGITLTYRLGKGNDAYCDCTL